MNWCGTARSKRVLLAEVLGCLGSWVTEGEALGAASYALRFAKSALPKASPSATSVWVRQH